MKGPLAICFLFATVQATAQVSDDIPVRLPLCLDDVCSFVNADGEKVLTGYDPLADV